MFGIEKNETMTLIRMIYEEGLIRVKYWLMIWPKAQHVWWTATFIWLNTFPKCRQRVSGLSILLFFFPQSWILGKRFHSSLILNYKTYVNIPLSTVDLLKYKIPFYHWVHSFTNAGESMLSTNNFSLYFGRKLHTVIAYSKINKL